MESDKASMKKHESRINWLNLPATNWRDILNFLDHKSLLRVTETCSFFEYIFNTSPVLINKVNLLIKYPEMETEANIIEMEEIVQVLSQTSRRYHNFEVQRLRDRYIDPDNEAARKYFYTLTETLGQSVEHLKIENCFMPREEFITILRQFPNLVSCTLINIMLDDLMPSQIIEHDENAHNVSLPCSKLKALILSLCDFYCLLLFNDRVQLETFHLVQPDYERPDVMILEDFLLKQAQLIDLKIEGFRFNSSHSTQRLASVPFQLRSLSLGGRDSGVTWDVLKEGALFFKSQRSLQKLSLMRLTDFIQPRETNLTIFSDILNHIINSNPLLEEFVVAEIPSNLKENDLLLVGHNTNVKTIKYYAGLNDVSSFLKTLARTFPKVQHVMLNEKSSNIGPGTSIAELLANWTELKSLKLFSTRKAFSNLHLQAPDLKSFAFISMNEEKCLEAIRDFINKHPTITHLTLDIEPLTIQELTELTIKIAPILETLNITDIRFNKEEAEMFIKNYQKLRSISCDIPQMKDVKDLFDDVGIKFTTVESIE